MNKEMSSKFLEEIGKIQEPPIFLGVARLLKVKLVEEDKLNEKVGVRARDFSDILADVMEKYAAAPKKRQKELYTILRQANKGGAPDGNSTKNS